MLYLLALAESFHGSGSKPWSRKRLKLCCSRLSVGPVTSQEAHTNLHTGTIKLQDNYKIAYTPVILQETYSKNSFFLNWIIRKSRLTSKLTQLNFSFNSHERREGDYRGMALLFFKYGAKLGWVATPCPGRFPPGKKTRYPSYWGLGGPQAWFGWIRKFLRPSAFDTRTSSP